MLSLIKSFMPGLFWGFFQCKVRIKTSKIVENLDYTVWLFVSSLLWLCSISLHILKSAFLGVLSLGTPRKANFLKYDLYF